MPTNPNSIFAAAALAAALGASGVAVVTNLGTSGCVTTTYTVPYTDAAFAVASTTTSKTLATLASARQKLCKASEEPQVVFGGGSIADVKCTLGTDTPGNEAIYLGTPTALSVSQLTASQSQAGVRSGKDLTVPDSDLDVVLHCYAYGAGAAPELFGNGAVTNLTAGKVWVTVGVETLPDGT